MNNLLPFKGLSPRKIYVYHPISLEEAQDIILAMKSSDTLLMNLATLESTLAQQISDYVTVSTFALSGEHTKLGKDVHLFSPPSLSVSLFSSV